MSIVQIVVLDMISGRRAVVARTSFEEALAVIEELRAKRKKGDRIIHGIIHKWSKDGKVKGQARSQEWQDDPPARRARQGKAGEGVSREAVQGEVPDDG